jgi:ribA/ribD-fused uncharacterized protein
MNVQLCNEPDTEGPICFYEQKHYWLSNFSAFAVEYEGAVYPTSEHLYQALKFEDPKMREMVRNERSAHEAMKLAQRLPELYRPMWNKHKTAVMMTVCRLKLEQHPYIQKALLKTGERELIEASPIDAFWGWGPDKSGRNELGKVWMRLREELRASAE